MANIQQIFSEECRRLARKEIKVSIESMTKTISELRHAVADLRKQVKEMQQRIDKVSPAAVKPQPAADTPEKKLRLTQKGIRKIREKTGLSCPQFAKLLGVSYLSELNWENGKTVPRQEQMQKIAGIRSMGKRALKAALEAKGLAVKPVKKAQKAAPAPAKVAKEAAPAPAPAPVPAAEAETK